jgi:hypothetical protein
MLYDTHKLLSSFEYKTINRNFHKMCDLIEIFSWVNNEIIRLD